MAEVRKHRPSAAGPIAEALQAALGETVRPTTPGAPPRPGQDRTSTEPSVTTPPAVAMPFTQVSSGWVTLPNKKA